MRGAELLFQPRHLRLELAHLGTEGVALGRLRPPLVRRQALKRAATPGIAPSGQMRGVQPLTAREPPDLARSRTPVRLLHDPKPILGSELAPRRLGHGLRIRSCLTDFAPGEPRARLRPGHRVCLCSHRFSPPRPTLIPRGAGVSGMLAERAPLSEDLIHGHHTRRPVWPTDSCKNDQFATALPSPDKWEAGLMYRSSWEPWDHGVNHRRRGTDVEHHRPSVSVRQLRANVNVAAEDHKPPKSRKTKCSISRHVRDQAAAARLHIPEQLTLKEAVFSHTDGFASTNHRCQNNPELELS